MTDILYDRVNLALAIGFFFMIAIFYHLLSSSISKKTEPPVEPKEPVRIPLRRRKPR